jgi:hypothetical protein
MSERYFNTESQTPVSQKSKLSGMSILLLITTVIFVGATIFLFADNQSKSKQLTMASEEATASEKRYTDLDAKYTAALSEIESYKGKNASLDSMLAVKEQYILTLRSNLNQEKKNRTISEAEYKRQMNDLNTLVSDLSRKVEELQKQNLLLTGQRDSLGREITQKASVIQELETSNSSLSKKVTVASLLIPTELSASAVRAKSSGKEAETSKAGKAQSLKVCFDIPENKVAEPGEKTFFVRILSPEGSVLAVQSQGSGIFTSVETGEQMQYTTTATIDYDQMPKEVCSSWSQSTGFVSGRYTAEIYQDGYLVGKTAFDLK